MTPKEKITNEIKDMIGPEEDVKDIAYGLKRLLDETRTSTKQLGNIAQKIEDINKSESEDKLLEAVSILKNNLDDFDKNFPLLLKALDKKQTVEVKFPDKEITIKKPFWWKTVDFGKQLKEAFSQLKQDVLPVRVVNEKPDQAMPVRLVDARGKSFYNAVLSVVKANTGSVVNLKNKSGSIINPATEATLSSILSALEGTISVDIADGLSFDPNSDDWTSGLSLQVLPFNYYYNASSGKWDRMRGDATNGLLVNLGSNNDVDTELPSAVALSDTFANPTAPAVGSFLMGWNFTTWDRLIAHFLSSDGHGSSTGLETVARVLVYDEDNSHWDRLRGDSVNGAKVYSKRKAKIEAYQTNDIDETTTANTTYFGLEDEDGNWCVKRIDESADPITVQYATVANNGAVSNYSDAWSNIATLTYNDYVTAF